MKVFGFKVPISAVAYIEIEAETEEEAREKIFDQVELGHIEEWQALERVNQGNVCYSLRPWEIELDYEDEVSA